MLSLVLLLWAEVGALVTQVRVLPTQPLACLALDEASRGDHVGRLRLMVFGGGETTDQRTAARLLARNHSGWLTYHLIRPRSLHVFDLYHTPILR